MICPLCSYPLEDHGLTEQGYIRVRVPGHHLSSVNGYAYEHRLVMEKKLGRPLLRREIVHHINQVRADNAPENLELMPSRWHHNAHHRRLSTPRQEPGQANELVACACGCGEQIWRFNKHHVEVRFVSGHNSHLNKKDRPKKPRQGEYNRIKMHCPTGHPYSPENTSYKKTKSGTRRICRTCHRLQETRRREVRNGQPQQPR